MSYNILDDHEFEILDDEGIVKTHKPIGSGRRFTTMLLDYLLLIMIVGSAFAIPLPGEVPLIAPFVLVFMIFFKDSIGGKSLVKRMLKLRIIDIKTGKTPSLLKLSLRVWTVPLGMIEGIVALTNPDNRRIGDLLTGTMVVEDLEPSSLKDDFQNTNHLQLVALYAAHCSLILLFLFVGVA